VPIEDAPFRISARCLVPGNKTSHDTMSLVVLVEHDFCVSVKDRRL